jgi:hypothetical protein
MVEEDLQKTIAGLGGSSDCSFDAPWLADVAPGYLLADAYNIVIVVHDLCGCLRHSHTGVGMS